jgi:hypothetical protein
LPRFFSELPATSLTGGRDVGEVDARSAGGDKGSGGGETINGGVAPATAWSILDASVQKAMSITEKLEQENL